MRTTEGCKSRFSTSPHQTLEKTLLGKYIAGLFVGAVLDYFKNNPEFRDELIDSFVGKLTVKFPDFSNTPKEVVQEVGEFINTVTERLVPDVNSFAAEVAKRIPGLDGITSLLSRFGIR